MPAEFSSLVRVGTMRGQAIVACQYRIVMFSEGGGNFFSHMD
jgi:hypothetical protein